MSDDLIYLIRKSTGKDTNGKPVYVSGVDDDGNTYRAKKQKEINRGAEEKSFHKIPEGSGL